MHPVPAPAGRLRLEGQRHVLRERRRPHRRHVAVGLLQVDAAHLPVRDPVDEDVLPLRDLLDRVADRALRLVEERQRVEEARLGPLPDLLADFTQHGVGGRERREPGADAHPRHPQAGELR